MSTFKKIIHLIYRIPVSIVAASISYYIVKLIGVAMATQFGYIMGAILVSMFVTWVPLFVPLAIIVLYGFGEFIFPPKEPQEPVQRFPRI